MILVIQYQAMEYDLHQVPDYSQPEALHEHTHLAA